MSIFKRERAIILINWTNEFLNKAVIMIPTIGTKLPIIQGRAKRTLRIIIHIATIAFCKVVFLQAELTSVIFETTFAI